MKFGFASSSLLVFLVSTSSLSQESIPDSARDAFVSEFREVFSTRYTESLSKTGLSAEEIARIVDALAIGYASCNVDFFLSRPEEEFLYALELMANGSKNEELKRLMGGRFDVINRVLEVHGTEISECYTALHHELGLPGF